MHIDRPYRVLIASPDAPYARVLENHIQIDGYETERVSDAPGVLRLLGRRAYDVILLDLHLTEDVDVHLVSYARRKLPQAQLILLFDSHQVDRAIEGLRQGAYFYLPKSCQPSDVALVVNKAMRTLQAQARISQYEQTLFEEMAGSTPAMKRVIELITKVAPTDSTVLLLGESGTGKEVVANTLHRLSNRRDQPFIAINCAALPEQLLESEMFGHVKGAFTGADSDKRGLFEEADGGTIFLDEIGDMSPLTQSKLLRVLQSGETRRVGSNAPQRVDVRVVAATNVDLVEAVQAKRFREDLYFRLNVIQIRIPPLRERMDALPMLVNHFLQRYNTKYGKTIRGVDPHAQVLLRTYTYPGNVRELESIIAHAVIMNDGDEIRAQDLPDHVRFGTGPQLALPDYASEALPTLSEMEARLIRTALERLDGNQTEAARQLGISRSTLWRKIKEYDITQ